jgi:acyl carrier protein
MDADFLERRIRAFLSDELGIEGELGRDDELLSTGLVDSADLMRLANYLEKQVEIEIPDRDINAVHFDSIAKIVAYAEARRQGGGPS